MELEIKLLWCRGLTAFNFFQKLTVYVSGSIISEDERIKLTQEQKQEQKTPVDEEGDGNPEWNYTMNFDLKSIPNITNIQNFSIIFEVRNHGQVLWDKNIGEVRVPLKDLIESVGFGVVRFASYEVRSSDGKPNGVLDFSYKVDSDLENGSEIQITGYNHNHNHHHHQSDDLDQSGLKYPERIEYPKIEFEKLSGNLIPSENVEFQYYPPHSYTPPGPPMWAPPPSHFPPPPMWAPPPPYGDPHWGYHRPPPANYQESCGWYGHHHW